MEEDGWVTSENEQDGRVTSENEQDGRVTSENEHLDLVKRNKHNTCRK